jgi:ribosomal protein S18 acetylase RimI-like enzyme
VLDVTATVRGAEPGDVEAIVGFGSAVVPAHYEPILGEAAALGQLAWWGPDRMVAAVAAGRVVVAEVAGRVVGVVETGELGGEQVVWKLYLAPEVRGRSLGVELLRHAVATLPVGVDHVLVEHVAGNARAAAFYERQGFEVVRTEPARSGDPAAAVVWRRLDL